jgi:hypothetical protein
MKHAVEIALHGMINVRAFMEIGRGIQAILRFCFRNLKDCNVGITAGMDICSMPFNGLRWDDIHTKFHDDRFRDLANMTVIIATI